MINFYKNYQHFYCYVYFNPIPNLLEILDDFKLHFLSKEKTRASVFLPIFEASVTLWFPW